MINTNAQTANDLRRQIEENKIKVRELEKREEIQADMNDLAFAIAAAHRGLVNAGFTDDEAFDLVKQLIKSNGGKK